MRKIVRIAALMLAAVVLAVPSMALAQVQYLELTASDDAYSERATIEVPAGGFPENTVEEGVNPITGEGFTGAYQPILTIIDMHPDAQPNWGVSSADLMYEVPIQRDGSTRGLALFLSEVPTAAGPVRSARRSHADLREMWDCGVDADI